MSSLIPNSTESLQMMLLSDGPDLLSGPHTNQELLAGATAGFTPGVTAVPVYDQRWSVLNHASGNEASRPWLFDHMLAITAFPRNVQFGPQSSLPPYEASNARLPVIWAHTNVSQTQPRGIREHVIDRNSRGRGNLKRASTRPEVQRNCADCNRKYKRNQEFKRHMKDKHDPPRQCPFCDFKWTRPDKIKAHIVADHQEKLSAEMLNYVEPLCGRQVVEFVDGIAGPYGHSLDVNAATFHSSVSQGPSLS